MQRSCASCGVQYEARRPSSLYCSGRCRQRAQRAKNAGRPIGAASASKPTKVAKAIPIRQSGGGELEQAIHRELERADRLETMLGQIALELSRRIGSSFETGSAVAALTKQLRETMAEALKGVSVAADPLDELRARRDVKRHTG